MDWLKNIPTTSLEKKVEDPKTKKVDSRTGFKKKTANVKAMDADMDSDVDKTQNEDSDSEEQTKN